MNREEFMKTLHGYVPNKLADMLAEIAEDEGYFDEEDVLPLSEATDSDLLAELSRRTVTLKPLKERSLGFHDKYDAVIKASIKASINELQNAKKALRNNPSEFICGDLYGRGHRRTKE
ncbi:MAG: hypothetical protein MSH60_03560 [Ruminococcus sp.]|nr:hypothetical protein [Ruminococcus sp.]